jgi:hypothetical protein
MLRKLLIMLFCFVYILFSIGVAVNLHYCGGKLANVSFNHVNENNCCGLKMKKMNCCKEKCIAYKINDNQNGGSKSLLLNNNIKTLDIFYYPITTNLPGLKPILFFELNSGKPPNIDYGNTYLLNRVFRI